MNGFSEQRLDADNFGPSKGVLEAFDAFPKTKATYLTKARNGSALTVLLLTTCAWLVMTETTRWWGGDTTHTFSVDKGVGHNFQMNLDVVVAMNCGDVHVNVQDAAGDRILAGEKLKKDPTNWSQWGQSGGAHQLGKGKQDKQKLEREEDVHDYLGASRKKSFPRTPRFRGPANACRLYGSLEGNKVQGDFHITARGHGYQEFAPHLDHKAFNFSHHINELSFGPYYPSLINPLDQTFATTNENFYKFQYYLSIVPTIFTTEPSRLSSSTPPSGSNSWGFSSNTIWTNQYAVTEQSHSIPESSMNVPGIFVKYDIEPITLTIAEEWGGILSLLVRLVNVVSGVLVAGQWLYQIGDWAYETWLKKGRGRAQSQGVLTGRKSGDYSNYSAPSYAPQPDYGNQPGYGNRPEAPQQVPSYGYGMPPSYEKRRSD